MTISEKFEHFQYFNFENDFLENENFFEKTGVSHKDWKGIIYIQKKLPYQKPMLRQIEW